MLRGRGGGCGRREGGREPTRRIAEEQEIPLKEDEEDIHKNRLQQTKKEVCPLVNYGLVFGFLAVKWGLLGQGTGIWGRWGAGEYRYRFFPLDPLCWGSVRQIIKEAWCCYSIVDGSRKR